MKEITETDRIARDFGAFPQLFSLSYDAIVNCDIITDTTRKANCRALDIARERGESYPLPADCVQAAGELKVSESAVAASWGYLRERDGNGDYPDGWVSIRRTYTGRDDDRFCHIPDQETHLCLALAALGLGIDIPFSTSFARRPAPD